MKFIFSLSCVCLFVFGSGVQLIAQVQTTEPPSELENVAKDVNPVYAVVDQMPEFEGGETALTAFVSSQIQYPKDALDNGITGTVYVRFVISKTGEIYSFEVLRGIMGAASLSKEALRVARLTAGKWKPGMHGGKLVDVYRTLPVKFTQH